MGGFAPPCVVFFGFRFFVVEEAVSPQPFGESGVNMFMKHMKVAPARWFIFDELEGTVATFNVSPVQSDDVKLGEDPEHFVEPLYEDDASAMKFCVSPRSDFGFREKYPLRRFCSTRIVLHPLRPRAPPTRWEGDKTYCLSGTSGRTRSTRW